MTSNHIKIFQFNKIEHFNDDGECNKSCWQDAEEQIHNEYKNETDPRKIELLQQLISLLPNIRELDRPETILKNAEDGCDWHIHLV
mmetsp:Transcript_18713/g.27069  ORF Transcript_18713/g.27069 Transcript_18713/m.27069 type:complete len:86 (+) Transcript_18713:242-499(+)